MQWFITFADWYNANSDVIGVVFMVLSAALGIYLQTRNLRASLLELMVQTEKAARKGQLGPVNGQAIMDLVVRKAMTDLAPKLPPYLRLFATETNLRKLAQFAYDKTRRYLENGYLFPPVDDAAAGREDQPEPPVEQ